MPVQTAHPNGHFYSPVVDPAELQPRIPSLWPVNPEVAGIDFNDASHEHVLETLFPKHFGEFDYPEEAPAEDEHLRSFYVRNSQYSWLDARSLFVLLKEWKPARIIEIGSGYSSLLMADINQRYCNGRINISCVEPYPRPFLKKGIPGINEVIEQKVQDVPLALFEGLEAGDILFIDSSHVSKTGSDVNHIYFEIIPRLKPGVKIHIHDIFLPNEYPKEWVLDENRSWNEQYLVRALLMYSSALRVIFGCSYAMSKHSEKVRLALAHPKGLAFGGGSLWLVRK